MTPCVLLRPGTLSYAEGLALQHRTAAAVRDGAPDTLILLQHPHTYTLGARGTTTSLLQSESAYRARGADVVRSDRGGDVTYHGPGQIVGYPIVSLRARGTGPVAYVRALEQVMIDALAAYGIEAHRAPGRPGVWCGDAKIGAIGVKISGGIATHGFALNVSTDLSWFGTIVPCGIAGAGVTSLERVRGHAVAMADAEQHVIDAFAAVFGVTLADDAALEVAVGH